MQSLYLLAPFAVLLWLLPDKLYRSKATRVTLLAGAFVWMFGLTFVAAAEYFFFAEFDARLSKELPESRLKPVWPGLVAQFGAFKNITERREGPMQERQAVELILAFEKQTIVNRTVFDSAGRVAGLVFRPLDAAVLPK